MAEWVLPILTGIAAALFAGSPWVRHLITETLRHPKSTSVITRDQAGKVTSHVVPDHRNKHHVSAR